MYQIVLDFSTLRHNHVIFSTLGKYRHDLSTVSLTISPKTIIPIIEYEFLFPFQVRRHDGTTEYIDIVFFSNLKSS